MCLDSTDLQIIKELQENSRLQWKELGQKVHLTGQAAADRLKATINQMRGAHVAD